MFVASVDPRIHVGRMSSLHFGLLSGTEIKKISKVNVIHPEAQKGGIVQEGGVMDKSMGSAEKDKACLTCSNDVSNCPGHTGHIDLKGQIYNPLFMNQIVEVLRCVCFHCSLLLTDKTKKEFEHLGKIPNSKSRFDTLKKLIGKPDPNTICKGNFNRSTKSYEGCGGVQPIYRRESNNKFVIDVEFNMTSPAFDIVGLNKKETKIKKNKKTLSMKQVYDILRSIRKEDWYFLGFDGAMNSPEALMHTAILVPPIPNRPSNKSNHVTRRENEQTQQLSELVKNNNTNHKRREKNTYSNNNVSEKGKKNNIPRNYEEDLLTLTTSLAGYYDSDSVSEKMTVGTNTQKMPNKNTGGRFQYIQQKTGLLRNHLLGKRSEMCFRSTISPDPRLSLNECALPLEFAHQLPKTVCINNFNYEEYTRLLIEFDWEDPKFSLLVSDENKNFQEITKENLSRILPLKVGWYLKVPLVDGDCVSLNRQPSLHAPSIQAFKAIFKKGSTIRINECICPPFNADFDGDEMTGYVETTIQGKAESLDLMLVEKNMITSQNGNPCMGLVQNGLTGAYLLSQKDTFFSKHEAFNYFMMSSNWGIQDPPAPAIIKPTCLWTGKQIHSYLLPDDFVWEGESSSYKHLGKSNPVINGLRDGDIWTSSIKETEHTVAKWFNHNDTHVQVLKGEHISGSLCKLSIGTSSGSIIHYLFNHYGSTTNRLYIENLQKICIDYIQHKGLSVGLQDLEMPTIHTVVKNRRKMDQAERILKEWKDSGMSTKDYENYANLALNAARNDISEGTLRDMKNRNSLKIMVSAGAKGSPGNIAQIGKIHGQLTISDQRVENGLKERVMSCYEVGDRSAEACGFIMSNFMVALNPVEYFQTAQATRKALIDSVNKTSTTGYMQRRIVKAAEDAIIKEDGTVRDALGQIAQFQYGCDSLDGKSLEMQTIPWMKMNESQFEKEYLWDDQTVQTCQQFYPTKDHQNWLIAEKNRLIKDQTYKSKLKYHLKSAINSDFVMKRFTTSKPRNWQSDMKPNEVAQLVYILQLCMWKEAKNFTITWEAIVAIVLRSNMSSKRVLQVYRMDRKEFHAALLECMIMFLRSIGCSGYAAGIVAGQSLGQAITQMTLNTFHAAGKSEFNVVMGIPRMQEITNQPKEQKSPSMTLYLKAPYSSNYSTAKKVASSLVYNPLKSYVVKKEFLFKPYARKVTEAEWESFAAAPTPEVLPGFRLADMPFDRLVNTYTDYNDINFADKNAVNDIMFSAIPDNLPSKKLQFSPWVMKFWINKEKLKQEGRSLYSIVQLLESKFKNRLIVQYSDEWSEHCFLQIRNLFEFGGSKYIAEESAAYLLNNVIINGYPEIKNVYVKKEDSEFIITTEGSNLKAAFLHPLIDRKKSFTNSIPETNSVLGIQAAKKLIEHQLHAVLSSFKIHVESRHMILISDIMCHKGSIMPLTRFGLKGMHTGVLTKASFEETKDVIKDAARFGFCENIKGSAACIIVGNMPPIGTGVVDVLPDVERFVNAVDNGDEKLSSELVEKLTAKLDSLKNGETIGNTRISKHKANFRLHDDDSGGEDMDME